MWAFFPCEKKVLRKQGQVAHQLASEKIKEVTSLIDL